MYKTKTTKTTTKEIKKRLEYLRGEIKAERISYGEIAELQVLREYIDPGDVELLEWSGAEENKDNKMKRYNVIWEEKHNIIVEAKNEEEAIDKVNEGQGSDDNSEIVGSFEAFEIKEEEKKEGDNQNE